MRRYVAFFLALAWFVGASWEASASVSRRGDDPSPLLPKKPWTVLVYLNGNNDLDRFGSEDLNEMEQVGSNANFQIIVQWASLRAGTTKRMRIERDNEASKVTSPVVEDMGRVDMGDWRSLLEFIRWGVEHYPADHYFVDVWDHGSGWHARQAGFRPLDISWDDNSGNFIRTEELSSVIRQAGEMLGKPIDIYGSDACLMGMAEVAAEMTGAVNVYIGSEETEPAKGWPYDKFFRRWADAPGSSAEAVAKMLVEEFVRSYQNGSQGNDDVTLSALDLRSFQPLEEATRKLGEAIRALDPKDRAQALAAARGTLSFADSDYRDLADFAAKLEGVPFASLAAPIAELREAMKNTVIANGVTSRYAKAKGIAIWLPPTKSRYESYSKRYQGLRFDQVTNWSKALEWLY